jgi:hypothetical protein
VSCVVGWVVSDVSKALHSLEIFGTTHPTIQRHNLGELKRKNYEIYFSNPFCALNTTLFSESRVIYVLSIFNDWICEHKLL